jgi:ABC-type molybdenum transport system ATPase subunit/photorepair protein PhrA
MSVKQSGRLVQFSRMDPGERLRLKLAFHLALLSLAAQRELGRHPGLLIIDAPASSEMDDLHFSAIVKRLGEIGQSLGERVQILIASARDDLAEICSDDHMERKRGGEVLF